MQIEFQAKEMWLVVKKQDILLARCYYTCHSCNLSGWFNPDPSSKQLAVMFLFMAVDLPFCGLIP